MGKGSCPNLRSWEVTHSWIELWSSAELLGDGVGEFCLYWVWIIYIYLLGLKLTFNDFQRILKDLRIQNRRGLVLIKRTFYQLPSKRVKVRYRELAQMVNRDVFLRSQWGLMTIMTFLAPYLSLVSSLHWLIVTNYVVQCGGVTLPVPGQISTKTLSHHS